MRGGVSVIVSSDAEDVESSPRAWGCFLSAGVTPAACPVFPTCVGVFLSGKPASISVTGLSHVRGGVSTVKEYVGAAASSSPRAWGCFPYGGNHSVPLQVFPTCVGVFLDGKRQAFRGGGLPHVRGGVSV